MKSRGEEVSMAAMDPNLSPTGAGFDISLKQDHYVVKDGKLFIGDKECVVRQGGKAIKDTATLEKIADVFNKTLAEETIQKGQTWRITPEGVQVLNSKGKELKEVTQKLMGGAPSEVVKSEFGSLMTALKTDRVRSNSLPTTTSTTTPETTRPRSESAPTSTTSTREPKIDLEETPEPTPSRRTSVRETLGQVKSTLAKGVDALREKFSKKPEPEDIEIVRAETAPTGEAKGVHDERETAVELEVTVSPEETPPTGQPVPTFGTNTFDLLKNMDDEDETGLEEGVDVHGAGEAVDESAVSAPSPSEVTISPEQAKIEEKQPEPSKRSSVRETLGQVKSALAKGVDVLREKLGGARKQENVPDNVPIGRPDEPVARVAQGQRKLTTEVKPEAQLQATYDGLLGKINLDVDALNFKNGGKLDALIGRLEGHEECKAEVALLKNLKNANEALVNEAKERIAEDGKGLEALFQSPAFKAYEKLLAGYMLIHGDLEVKIKNLGLKGASEELGKFIQVFPTMLVSVGELQKLSGKIAGKEDDVPHLEGVFNRVAENLVLHNNIQELRDVLVGLREGKRITLRVIQDRTNEGTVVEKTRLVTADKSVTERLDVKPKAVERLIELVSQLHASGVPLGNELLSSLVKNRDFQNALTDSQRQIVNGFVMKDYELQAARGDISLESK